MDAENTDKLKKVASNTGWQVGGGGVADAVVTTIPGVSLTGLPTDTAVLVTIDRVDSSGTKTPTKMERVVGLVSGNNLVSCIRGVEGLAQAHSGGAVMEIVIAPKSWNDIIDHLLTEHNQDGTHKNLPTGLQRQAIINGGFTVNQRGYVSAATLASGAYGHDRWKGGASGGDYSFTQLAQSTQITIAASKSLIQVVEDKNVIGGTYTLSWTGTAQARLGINSATPSGSYASSPITISGQTAGTVMSVEFNTGTLSGVQLNIGSVALPFQPKGFDETLRECMRYYEKSFDYSVTPADNTGSSGGSLASTAQATGSYLYIGNPIYRVRKRTAVTPTLYNPSASNANKLYNTSASTSIPGLVQFQGETGFQVIVLNTSVSTGQTVITHWTAEAEL